MNIRNLLATTTICGIMTLTGCVAKEAAKIDMTPPAATTSASMPAPAMEGGHNAADSAAADTTITAAGSAAGGTAGQADDAGRNARLEPVYFDFDSCLLTVEGRNTLTRNARWMDENQHQHVVIEGHADERGSDEYNLALGEKRAKAARRYMETLGVSNERLETISYGEEKPAVTGHDAAAWAKNRRIEFVIVK